MLSPIGVQSFDLPQYRTTALEGAKSDFFSAKRLVNLPKANSIQEFFLADEAQPIISAAAGLPCAERHDQIRDGDPKAAKRLPLRKHGERPPSLGFSYESRPMPLARTSVKADFLFLTQ
jgi:hypothetical protein